MKDINNKKEFINAIMGLISEIQSEIDENKDTRTKEIGDRVLIWDGSYNLDKNTGKHRNGIDKLFQNPGIVIQTNCEIEYIEELMDELVVLDLLIKFDTGEEVYTNSDMVKRIDKDNI